MINERSAHDFPTPFTAFERAENLSLFTIADVDQHAIDLGTPGLPPNFDPLLHRQGNKLRSVAAADEPGRASAFDRGQLTCPFIWKRNPS